MPKTLMWWHDDGGVWWPKAQEFWAWVGRLWIANHGCWWWHDGCPNTTRGSPRLRGNEWVLVVSQSWVSVVVRGKPIVDWRWTYVGKRRSAKSAVSDTHVSPRGCPSQPSDGRPRSAYMDTHNIPPRWASVDAQQHESVGVRIACVMDAHDLHNVGVRIVVRSKCGCPRHVGVEACITPAHVARQHTPPVGKCKTHDHVRQKN